MDSVKEFILFLLNKLNEINIEITSTSVSEFDLLVDTKPSFFIVTFLIDHKEKKCVSLQSHTPPRRQTSIELKTQQHIRRVASAPSSSVSAGFGGTRKC